MDEAPVDIVGVKVRRRVEVPGEELTLPARLQPRQPERVDGEPGSSWVLDLGGDDVPCDRVEFAIADQQFVRNFRIEAGGPSNSDQPFRRVAAGVWRRRAGETPTPMVARFGEVRASRLKLVITDFRNPPLQVESAKFIAAARQVVFAGSNDPKGPLRLYFGNPKATAPNYDFARNLPAHLDPAPVRLTPSPRRDNPTFLPEPKPLTERWPWLIYVVLGGAVTVLGAIIASLAKATVAAHDARQPPADELAEAIP